MRGSSLFKGGETLTTFFLVDTTKGGSFSSRQRNLNGVSLAGRWWPITECLYGRFLVLKGSRPVLLRDPIFFVIFQEGYGSYPPSGSAHEYK